MSHQNHDGRNGRSHTNPGFDFTTSPGDVSGNQSYHSAYPQGGQQLWQTQEEESFRERRSYRECSLVTRVLIVILVFSVVVALTGALLGVYIWDDVKTSGNNITELPTIDTNNIAVTPTSATITLNNIFTNLSASALYSLFVATSPDQSQLNESNTWAAVQGMDPQPPYVAIYRCANLFSAGATCPATRVKRQASNSITLGQDNSCNSTAANVYCNGPLKPNTQYYVSYRAHDKGLSYDSPFSPPIATAVLTTSEPATARVAETTQIDTTEAQTTPEASTKAQTTGTATRKPQITERATTVFTTQSVKDGLETSEPTTTTLTVAETTQIATTPEATTKTRTTEAQKTPEATMAQTTEVLSTPAATSKSQTKAVTVKSQMTEPATTQVSMDTTTEPTTVAKTTKSPTTMAQTTKIPTTEAQTTKIPTTQTQTTKVPTTEAQTTKLYTTVLTTPEKVLDTTEPATTMSQTTVQDTPLPTIVFDNSTITAVSAIISVNNNFKNLSSSTQYSIIVSTSLNDTEVNENNTWASVQGMMPQPPYMALHKCANFFTLSDSCQLTKRTRRSTVSLLPSKGVHLGKETTCDLTAKDVYCNGQLTPEKKYYVKIRAYDGGTHYDSPYSPPIMTVALGEWEDWGQWGSCDATCGGGIQKRKRMCKQGGFCLGQNIQSRGCNKQSCPRQASTGKWSSWSSWSSCSVSCGGGLRNRSRLCDQGQRQNLTCVGVDSQVLECAPWRCPNCSYQCPIGTLNRPNCTHCECNNTAPVEGKVMSEQGVALNQVQIVLADGPSIILYTTGPSGNFTLLNLCLEEMVMFTKKGYSSQDVQMRDIMNVVIMKTLGSLSMDVHPSSKKRLLGDDVLLCCSASGNPPPDYYEWFKDGVQIMGQNGTTLSLLNVAKTDAGWYKCRANTEAKAAYSEEAALSVRANADDFCPNNPENNLQELPDGCTFNGSTFYDVGKCENLRCRGQDVNNETCNDELTYCCAGSQYQRINMECDGFNFTVDKVMECGCFQCSEPIVEIQGFVFDAETSAPIQDIDIYRNKTFEATTDSNGQFNLKVPQGTLRVTLTAKGGKNLTQSGNSTYGENTNVVVLNEYDNGVYYTTFKLNTVMRLPAIDSSKSNTIELLGKSNKTVVEIEIPADSVFDDEGNLFKGEVVPEIDVIDPRDEISIQSSPGDFTTIDDEGREQTLQTNGMFTVSLSNYLGKRLQIPNGLSINVPEAILGNITDNPNNRLEDIKLWKLNQQGSWDFANNIVETNSGSGRRKKRSPKLQVSIPGINIDNVWEWYNFDSYTRTICYSKVRVYESDISTVEKRKAEVLAIVKGNDGTHSLSRVRPVGDSDANGYCVLHRCDSPRNNGAHVGFRGYIVTQLDGKNLIPANKSLSDDLHNSLNYVATKDRIEVDFDLNKVSDKKGPFYDWGSPYFRYSKSCVEAPNTEPHFRFYLHEEEQCYRKFPKEDPKEEPSPTCNPIYYTAWHTAQERRANSYSFCFVKVKVAYGRNNFKVKAFSRVGDLLYGGTDFTIRPGDSYGYREDCPVTGEMCIEVKRPGKRSCSNNPNDGTSKDDKFTLVEISAKYKDSNIYLNVSKVNSLVQDEAKIHRNDSILSFELTEDLIGEPFGVYCTYMPTLSEVSRKSAFQDCMSSDLKVLAEFGRILTLGFSDYIIAFPKNHPTRTSKKFNLFVTAQKEVMFTLMDTVTGASETHRLTAGSSKRFTYDYDYAYNSAGSVVNGKIIYITSSEELSIYVEHLSTSFSSYTFKAWPIKSDFLQYTGIVTQVGSSWGHEFIIASNNDGTSVTIATSGGSTITKLLNKFQVYVHYTSSGNDDIVEIISDKPIIVLSSYICITLHIGYCDAAASQLLPIPYWSTEYVLPGFISKGINLQVVSSVITNTNGNTVIFTDSQGSTTHTVNKFQNITKDPSVKATKIVCSSSCFVQIFLVAGSSLNNFDPGLTFLTQPILGSNKVIYFSNQDPTGYLTNTNLVLIVHTNTVSSLRFNGNPMNVNWVTIPGSSFKYVNIDISENVHSIAYSGSINGYIFSQGTYSEGFVRQIS